ncbi:MAG: hypothetical protein ACE5R6_20105 [Candidatus Heimdallarchaeota archaeon]
MKSAKEFAEEYFENFEEYEEEARREREQSVDWDLVRKKCTPKQIEAIRVFVRYRFYEGAASIAQMDLLDFIELLDSLGIVRA